MKVGLSIRRIQGRNAHGPAGPMAMWTVVFCLLLHAEHVSSAARSTTSDNLLASRIEELINGPDYKQAHWGILIEDLEAAQVLYELNSSKFFLSASVAKLFSTATALDEFGLNYRFGTPVYRRGEVDDAGQLNGDLILVATGDLTMGGRSDGEGRIQFKDVDHVYANGNPNAELTDADPLSGLNELARQVAGLGIKRVRGDVLVDDRLFERAESSGSGPSRVSPITITTPGRSPKWWWPGDLNWPG